MMIGCQERTNWRRRIIEKPDRIPHWHRTKSVEPGTLKPGTIRSLRSGPAKRPIGYIFGLNAGPVDLKFACNAMASGGGGGLKHFCICMVCLLDYYSICLSKWGNTF